jgi:hypothetical protein
MTSTKHAAAFALVFGFLFSGLSAAGTFDASAAASMIGKSGTFCGKVAQVAEGKKQVFLNIGQAYPNQVLAVLIWNDKKPVFDQYFGSLRVLSNRKVCVKGEVKAYKGKPEIILTDPQALTLTK